MSGQEGCLPAGYRVTKYRVSRQPGCVQGVRSGRWPEVRPLVGTGPDPEGPCGLPERPHASNRSETCMEQVAR